MNAILLVKKDHGMGSFGHDAMANTVGVCDCILKDAKDGDQVNAKITGTLMEHDGKRYISIDEVDGQPVEDSEMSMDANPDEGSMDAPPSHDMGSSMDSEHALMQFMANKKAK